jgi:hypothetical protein
MDPLITAWTGQLAAAEHPGGGWGYGARMAWTEPTALAILALGAQSEAGRRGVAWLRGAARSDGGYAPQPAIAQSAWVTSLALLALHCAEDAAAADRARAWLLRQTGHESALAERLRRWLRGGAAPELDFAGWPWVGHTAGWAVPTALALTALRATAPAHDPACERLAEGRAFLLARAAQAGGWNHGSIRVFGIEGEAYPETTGCVLLGLRGTRSRAVALALERARSWAREPRPALGWAWLRLGLLAHGIEDGLQAPSAPPANPAELALALIARHATPQSSVLFGSAG